ncbi:hypothetical protein VTN02DRAFT_1163 [Thermoascus thermophilus]
MHGARNPACQRSRRRVLRRGELFRWTRPEYCVRCRPTDSALQHTKASPARPVEMTGDSGSMGARVGIQQRRAEASRRRCQGKRFRRASVCQGNPRMPLREGVLQICTTQSKTLARHDAMPRWEGHKKINRCRTFSLLPALAMETDSLYRSGSH